MNNRESRRDNTDVLLQTVPKKNGGQCLRRSAADTGRADDEVVEVAFLRRRRTGVPVVLEKHGVDAVRVVAPDPVEIRPLPLELAVDPELIHAVALAGIVELHVRLNAIPLTDACTAVQRRRPGSRAEPSQMSEVVVRRGDDVTNQVRA